MKSNTRVVFVAGGTGGLGRAVSLAFLEEGAQVAVTYRKQEELEALKKQADSGASRLEGFNIDVTDESAVSALVEGIVTQHGGLDVLVNTVGGYTGGVKLWEMETADFDKMIALNLRAAYCLSRAAVRAMLKQRSGTIVNVAAKAAFDHETGQAAYAATKAAEVALMDSLAAELKGSGVRVNSVLPSVIDTEENRKAMPKADFTQWPKPEEIARVIVFLSGNGAKVIHGASIPVFGNS